MRHRIAGASDSRGQPLFTPPEPSRLPRQFEAKRCNDEFVMFLSNDRRRSDATQFRSSGPQLIRRRGPRWRPPPSTRTWSDNSWRVDGPEGIVASISPSFRCRGIAVRWLGRICDLTSMNDRFSQINTLNPHQFRAERRSVKQYGHDTLLATQCVFELAPDLRRLACVTAPHHEELGRAVNLRLQTLEWSGSRVACPPPRDPLLLRGQLPSRRRRPLSSVAHPRAHVHLDDQIYLRSMALEHLQEGHARFSPLGRLA
jgi:hypothetical protein